MSESRRDDLSVYEVAYIFWERKLLVSGAVFVCLAGAMLFTFSRSASYTVEAVVIVQPAREDLSRNEREVFLEEVSAIVASDEGLFEQATERSDWTGSAAGFRDRLEPVYFVRDSGEVGLDIRFTSADPEVAVSAANSYAALFVERAANLDESQLSGGTGVSEARVGSRASASESRGSRRPVLYAGGAIALGVILGGGAALLIEGRTRSWRDARDAEMTLRAPVIGVIPDYETLGIARDAETDETTEGATR